MKIALALMTALAFLGTPCDSGIIQPEPALTAFSAEDLRADLLQIRSALENSHPAVYGFTDKESFERLYEKQIGLITGPMTLGQFYSIAAPLITAVGCGHTRLITPPAYWQNAPARFFPLKIRFFGNRAFVTGASEAAARLPAGSEIAAINGQTIPEILAVLKSLTSSDGANDGNKTFRLSAAFAPIYAHRFGFPEEFVVEARLPGRNEPETLRLRGVSYNQIPADPPRNNRPTSTGDPNLDFEILEDPAGTAILTIRNFSYYQAVDKFKAFIDDSFTRIRAAGVRNLILDLRDNGGGDPFCTTHLLGYLEPNPIPYFARVYPGGYARFAEPIPRAAGAFEGKLFVLINQGCFSSTGHITALLKEHAIGTLIGSETGGTYECNDASREVRLKNSGLAVTIARMTFTAAVKTLPRYRGVLPDYPVEPGIADYLSGKDPVLERAFALIKK